jgi:TonB family protein
MSAELRGENVVERHYPLFVTAALGASLFLHGVAYASLSLAPAAPRRTEMASQVTFELAPVPAPTREEVPMSPPEQEKPALQRPRPAPRPAEPPPREAAPQTAEAPANLGGVTLTDDTGAGAWSSATGNGQSMEVPQGPVAPRRSVAAIVSSTPLRQAPNTNRLVMPSDLSERPRPPALDDVLRRHYPEEARRRGISGTASVRAEVGADGRVRHARVLSQSFPGFGEACRRTLAGSRWSPPKDRRGYAVPTEIGYKCRFVVDR